MEMTYSDILFLSGQETSAFILQDRDHYIRSLSNYDLAARHAQSQEQYASASAASATSFTREEKLRLSSCCEAADRAVSERLADDPRVQRWVNARALAGIRWKIGITRDPTYEGGYPHTRADVIFLCRPEVSKMTDAELQTMLLHEKIHVYQRIYNDEFGMFIRANGYHKFCYRKSLCMARANPDLDKYVYCDRHGNMMAALYAREKPEGITDVIYTGPHGHEHPNEVCAYAVSRLCTSALNEY